MRLMTAWAEPLKWARDLKVHGGSSSQLAGDTGQKDPVAQDVSEQKFVKTGS